MRQDFEEIRYVYMHVRERERERERSHLLLGSCDIKLGRREGGREEEGEGGRVSLKLVCNDAFLWTCTYECALRILWQLLF